MAPTTRKGSAPAPQGRWNTAAGFHLTMRQMVLRSKPAGALPEAEGSEYDSWSAAHRSGQRSFSSFKHLLHAVKYHCPILLGMAGFFRSGIVVLGNGQPGSATFGRQFIADSFVAFGDIGQAG